MPILEKYTGGFDIEFFKKFCIFIRQLATRRWSNGRMLAIQAKDDGSIPSLLL